MSKTGQGLFIKTDTNYMKRMSLFDLIFNVLKDGRVIFIFIAVFLYLAFFLYVLHYKKKPRKIKVKKIKEEAASPAPKEADDEDDETI